MQADDPAAVQKLRRLEDSPFYARAELRTRLFGEPARAVHETRDETWWVKLLLPFRMPRVPF